MRKSLTVCCAFSAIVAGSTLLLSGCWFATGAAVGGAAGIGGTAYVEGNLKDTIDAPMAACKLAVAKTVEQMNFTDQSITSDALNYTLTCKNAEDKTVTIGLAQVTDTTTTLSVKVGIFGDEEQSMKTMDAIKANLPKW